MPTSTRGVIALVGSGEYLESMSALEGQLLEASRTRGLASTYLQIPTAAGQESPERIAYWKKLGADQATRLNVEQIFLPVFSREDAFKKENITAVESAGLIYLSGGDPHYLAQSLAGTPLWEAIVHAWQAGTSLAGCSAGAMVFGAKIMGFRKSRESDGLAILGHIQTIPHYDRFLGWIPDSLAGMIAKSPVNLVGIDEGTALTCDHPGDQWRIWGSGKVHLLNAHPPRSFRAPEVITLDELQK